MKNLPILLLVLSVACSLGATQLRFNAHLGIPAFTFALLAVASFLLPEDDRRQKWVFIVAGLAAAFGGLMQSGSF